MLNILLSLALLACIGCGHRTAPTDAPVSQDAGDADAGGAGSAPVRDAGVPADADAGVADAGSRPWTDGWPSDLDAYPLAAPVQLAQHVHSITAVSPDEAHLLVTDDALDSAPGCDCGCVWAHPSSVLDTTTGAASPLLHGAAWAAFSKDGRSLVYGDGDCFTRSYVAHADGSGVRAINGTGFAAFAGEDWLYFEDWDRARSTTTLKRLQAPDGEPEVLVTLNAATSSPGEPAPTSSGLSWLPSPDGRSVAWFATGAVPTLRVPSGKDISLPGRPVAWSASSGWLLTTPCDVVDLAGNDVRLADDCFVEGFSSDGTRVAIGHGRGSTAGVVVYEHSSGNRVDLPGLPSSHEALSWLRFAPAGDRLLADVDTFGAVTCVAASVYQASLAGGVWELLSDDVGNEGWNHEGSVGAAADAFSAGSLARGTVLSVAGRAPFAVTPPAGHALAAYAALFEPPGGHDAAAFIEQASGDTFICGGTSTKVLLAHADGAGPWVDFGLPTRGDGGATWLGHGLVFVSPWSPVQEPWAAARDLFLSNDDGSARGIVARRVVNFAWAEQPRKLFYATVEGGLFSVELPP